ncbi:fructose-bisphosphate aldolase [Mycobacterium sp. ACS1612]|uniref:class II fructose-bisphosphate aldolase n=1 Tax=Mycobacterium sp. ACS1612 TaxID=1834117 RepID=UPI0007FDC1EA|nr:class II fructose-bisphosphate aldolase [Mycobacterium sp. ACS1612]OBF38058.1 fructose-bisphosphate aldolase [Mycobacterium sp. ACS1612]
MTLVATADLIAAAAKTHSAVLAFNVITLEHAEGIAEGAERVRVPALMQVSENAVKFRGGQIAPLVSACTHIARRCSTPLAVHLDHFQDEALITEALEVANGFGVTSIMIDAAHLPYQRNVDQTRSFARQAKNAGLWVEAELGEIGGKDNGPVSAHQSGARTDPAEAVAFVEQTGVDGLAVAVGSTHAMTTRDASLDLDLIRELADKVAIPLVLHGSSGVSDGQLLAAVDAGIRKINVGTALNVAYTGAVRSALTTDLAKPDPRGYLASGRRAIADTVAELCEAVATRQAASAGQGDAR